MRVKVYWNIRRHDWSVLDAKTGRVVQHRRALRLTGVQAVVQQGGRARVRATGVKNVHAFLVGQLMDEGDEAVEAAHVFISGAAFEGLKYNPKHEYTKFVAYSWLTGQHREVDGATEAVCLPGRIVVARGAYTLTP